MPVELLLDEDPTYRGLAVTKALSSKAYLVRFADRERGRHRHQLPASSPRMTKPCAVPELGRNGEHAGTPSRVPATTRLAHRFGTPRVGNVIDVEGEP